jgi:3-deoxy-D-arabino-heptulosonate 7-phosphate (DAHP) synthase
MIHTEPALRLAHREARPDGTVVSVRGIDIGGAEVVIIAGPCAVETEEQLLSTARAVKAGGAKMLRGGAFKPRTSPYSFQGLKADGLLIEVHCDPPSALSDGPHSLTPEAFAAMMTDLSAVAGAVGRRIGRAIASDGPGERPVP